jgi:hypothetical protein
VLKELIILMIVSFLAGFLVASIWFTLEINQITEALRLFNKEQP